MEVRSVRKDHNIAIPHANNLPPVHNTVIGLDLVEQMVSDKVTKSSLIAHATTVSNQIISAISPQ